MNGISHVWISPERYGKFVIYDVILQNNAIRDDRPGTGDPTSGGELNGRTDTEYSLYFWRN